MNEIPLSRMKLLPYLEYFAEAFSALMRNKLRSILTLLGMVIGVAAVDSVFGISTGLASAINGSIASGDNPNLTVTVDRSASRAYSIGGLEYRDAARVALSSGSIARATPFYSVFYGPRRYSVNTPTGKTAAFGFSWHGGDPKLLVVAGQAFSVQQTEAAARVCLLSQDLATKLFGSPDQSVGGTFRIHGERFEVIGVTDDQNGTASNYFAGSYYFVLPYTTYSDFDHGDVDGIFVWLNDTSREVAAKASILDALRRIHGAHAVYSIDSTRERLAQTQKVVEIIAAGLTAIGAVSLLVAGIGIMNIMLVAVSERTREIGLRRSIGARRADIAVQFIIESTVIAFIGATVGLLLSLGIIALASAAIQSRLGSVEVPFVTVILYAFFFAFLIGLTFGLYPAFRASRLDPATALRA